MGNGQHKDRRDNVITRTQSLNRKSSINSLTNVFSKSHHKQQSNQASASGSGLSNLSDGGGKTTDGMSRSASGSDINEKNYSIFLPTEKLAKILQQKTQHEFGVNGILAEVFVKNVFPQHPDFGFRFFHQLHKTAKAKTKHLGVTAFRQQCELYLNVLDDLLILEYYVKMFAGINTDPFDLEQKKEDDLTILTPDGLSALLIVCFKVAMSSYSEPQSFNQKQLKAIETDATAYCPYINRTISTVIQSCFFTKDSLSVGFVCRWLEENCPRIILPVHRFCVHTLTTVYRTIQNDAFDASKRLQDTDTLNQNKASREIGFDELSSFPLTMKSSKQADITSKAAALELSTPVLENVNNPFERSSGEPRRSPHLMPLSQAWLLAAALPPTFTRPQSVQRVEPQASGSTENTMKKTPSYSSNSGQFMSRLLSLVPSHWTLLYDSQQHGVGSNRFLHHVLGYKGPTLCLLHSKTDELFCLASPAEWRETHLYIGEQESHVIQLLPKFSVLEKGPKLLYLNTSIRGYPKGLRAGSDPRKPLIIIDEHFENILYRGVSSVLLSIEVWGCGDKQSREVQLDIKKWQVKEAERQRTVKLTAADWMENPDRYLLELGGRPQYNNS